MALGTIYCDTDHSTMDSLVATCGLRAAPTDVDHQFDIVGSSVHTEPDVDQELFSLALCKLKVASETGDLPEWRIVRRN